MTDNELIKAALVVWPFKGEEYAPYAIGVENGIVWATKRGIVGLCGYALIPAEGHPWSCNYPNGIDQEAETARSRALMKKIMDLTAQGVEFAEASAQVYGEQPSIDVDYLDRYLEAHGGITWYRHPWIGFDTGHSGDIWPPEWDEHNLSDIARRYRSPYSIEWNPDMVAEEAKRMARQVAEIGQLEKNLAIETDEALGR